MAGLSHSSREHSSNCLSCARVEDPWFIVTRALRLVRQVIDIEKWQWYMKQIVRGDMEKTQR